MQGVERRVDVFAVVVYHVELYLVVLKTEDGRLKDLGFLLAAERQ